MDSWFSVTEKACGKSSGTGHEATPRRAIIPCGHAMRHGVWLHWCRKIRSIDIGAIFHDENEPHFAQEHSSNERTQRRRTSEYSRGLPQAEKPEQSPGPLRGEDQQPRVSKIQSSRDFHAVSVLSCVFRHYRPLDTLRVSRSDSSQGVSHPREKKGRKYLLADN